MPLYEPSVIGPVTSTDTAIAVYDGSTGDKIKNTTATIDGSGNLSLSGTIDGYNLKTIFSGSQGSVLYRGASEWTQLAPGQDGYVLTTGGVGANPLWEIDRGTFTAELTKQPSGFASRTTTTLSVVDGTRTFSITPVSGSFSFFIHGTEYVKSSAQSVSFADAEGIHYFYFNSAGTLVTTQDSNTWISALSGDGALVSALYWDADANTSLLLVDERHGFMNPEAHVWMHQAFGMQWISGGSLNAFTIGTGDLASHAQFDVSSTLVYDEDISISITDGAPQDLSPIASIPIFYRSGASGVWRKKAADVYPLIYSGTAGYTGASGRAAYNQYTGATWQLTEVTNNDFVLVHYYATNNIAEPIIGIQGQNIYGTTALAQAGAEAELLQLSNVLNDLSKEITPLGTVIFQTSTGYANVPKARVVLTADGGNYVDFRGNVFRGGTTSGVTDHGLLAGLADDDHLQYLLVNGTRAMSGNLDLGTNNIINIGTVDGYDLASVFGGVQGSILYRNNTGWTQLAPGTDGYVLQTHGTGANPTWEYSSSASGIGGPGTSTDNAIVRWDGVTGNFIQNSTIVIDDSGNISGAGTINSINLSSHGSRHNPDGVDSLNTVAPPTTAVRIGNSTAIGVANSYSRSDHQHEVLIGTPVAITNANHDGYAVTFAASDHHHALGGAVGGDLSGTLPNPTVTDLTISGEQQGSILYRGTSGWTQLAPGTDGYVLTTNGTGANPTWEYSSTASGIGGPGTTTDNAIVRWDGITGTLVKDSSITVDGYGNISGVGTINAINLSSHGSRHNPGGIDPLSTGAPPTTAVRIGNSPAIGVANSYSRSDHQHEVLIGTPVAITNANHDGYAATFAASDHRHALGGTVGGDLSGTLPNPTVTDLTISGEAQGSVLYFNGSAWTQLAPGTDGYALITHGAAQNPSWGIVSASGGDVTGPASSTDNALARFNGLTGKIIKNSDATLTDGGDLTVSGTVGTQYVNHANSVTLQTGGIERLRVASANLYISASAGTLFATGYAAYLKHTDRGSDAATSNFTIQAQNAYASAVTNTSGGAIYLRPGAKTPASTGNDGYVYLQDANGINRLTVREDYALISPGPIYLGTYSAGYGTIWLGSGCSPAIATSYALSATGGYTDLNSTASVNMSINGSPRVRGTATNVVIVAPSGTQFSSAYACSLTHSPRVSNDPTGAFTITAQSAYASSTGANRNGASIYLLPGLAAAGGTDGYVYIRNASNADKLTIASGLITAYTNVSLNGNTIDGYHLPTLFGGEQGSILYRGASGWTQLAPGADGYVLQTHGTGANPTWEAPASGGSSGISSYPVGMTNDLTVNIEQNDAIWGSMIIPNSNMQVSQMQCQVTQTASGNVYFAIYDSSLSLLGSNSTGVSCSTVGIKSATLSSPVSLTSGNVYYLCARSDANGSRFSGVTCSSGTASPQFSIRKDSGAASSFPASFTTPSANAVLVWIAAR